MNNPKILVILGPTATGKSDLAVELAQKFNGEVVSADSRQVYKRMDLGSGKITKSEMKGVPHHLLDVADPVTEIFSVADFQKLAYEAINDILKRGKLPIVCGGTAFYIHTIVDGVVLPKINLNEKLRKKLEKWPIKKLQRKFKKLDPERFESIDQQNPVRLIRAIEIAKQLGKVPASQKNPKYECLQIGLKLSEEELREKISARLEKRLKTGMLDEAKDLYEAGMSWQRMEDLGLEYRFMAQHLQNKISYDEMCEQIKIKSRQFAKRQMTWFKKDKKINWFRPKNVEEIISLLEKFLSE
jgi:tRNA dimethylallyltransferase